MALRQSLLTKGLAQKASASNDLTSPIERSDAKTNMLKAMRPLPTQHYWNVYFDRPAPRPTSSSSRSASKDEPYTSNLETIPPQIESIQDFWRMANNTPLDLLKMRESIYLFKAGFKPIWEDRRNVNGGAWSFRVPKEKGSDFWLRVQLMAIGEQLQGCLEDGKSLFSSKKDLTIY